MNLSNNYHPINSKNFSTKKYNPYLLSTKENINNNYIPTYLPPDSNLTKPKREINSYNDVKKNFDLNITEYNRGTLNPKRDLLLNMQRYSSFTSHYSKNNNNIALGSIENNKKTLILDLDETLVHSAFTPFSRKSDLMLTINFDGENRLLYVLKRPHVDVFLKELSNLYEIIIFTASISEYANPLLDLLDKQNYIKYRLFREHCTFDNGIYIKDLKIIDRKLNNMIIIDNNPLSYDNNVANGIPILSWYEDMNDNELLKLIPILKYMSNKDVYDVRNIINQIVDRRTNEIDYNSINKIIGENKYEQYNLNNVNKNNKLMTKSEYRNINKSEEPRLKMLNVIDEEEKYNYYNQDQNKKIISKNNYTNLYSNENQKINILNSKFNIHNIYNYAFEQKPSINIDKKDPYGTRISIFSPEEYNDLYNKKSYHSPFNRNMYTINTIEESKDDFRKQINSQTDKNNYLINKYSSNTYSNKREPDKKYSTFTFKRDEYRENRNKDENASQKVYRTHSLVELTKKALHLNDKKEERKINKYDSVSKVLNAKNYLNGERKINYNNFVKENEKIINEYKSDKMFFNNNPNQTKYFRNYLQELNNTQKDANYLRNINSQRIMIKPNNPNNKKNQMISYTNNYDKDKLLKRMNNEKRNNYIERTYSNQRKNLGYTNYISKYSQKSKNNYVNMIKKSMEQNKTNLNMKSLNDTNINYAKNKTNLKMYNNKRYDLLNTHKNSELKNININHKSVSYINNKDNNFVNLKKSNGKKAEYYKEGNLVRSSSCVKHNNIVMDDIMENISLIDNSNKENIANKNNNNLINNLNYRYDVNFY